MSTASPQSSTDPSASSELLQGAGPTPQPSAGPWPCSRAGVTKGLVCVCWDGLFTVAGSLLRAVLEGWSTSRDTLWEDEQHHSAATEGAGGAGAG